MELQNDMEKLLRNNKNKLLEFLDKELARFEREDSQRGFTHWAILVAIAGITWAGLPLITNVNFVHTALWVYILESSIATVSLLNRAIYNEYNSSGSSRFFSSFHIDLAVSGEGYKFVLYCIVFIIGLNLLPASLAWTINFALWALPSLLALVGMLIPYLSGFPPISTSVSPKLTQALRCFHAGGAMFGFVLVNYCFSHKVTFQKYDIYSIQLAALIVTDTLLVSMYIRTSFEKRIARAIRSLLISLSFDEIDVQDAYDYAETLFLGEKVARALSKETLDLVFAINKLEELIAKMPATDEKQQIGYTDNKEQIIAVLKNADRVFSRLQFKIKYLPITSTLRAGDLEQMVADLLKRYQDRRLEISGLINKPIAVN